MWLKVAIFHAEQHTLLIQSLYSSEYFAYSPLLAAILLVSCGQILVLHSQPFSCGPHGPNRGKEAGYARPARPLFHAGHYRFQYNLTTIMPCVTKE